MSDLLHVIPAWLQLIFLTFFLGAVVCRLYVTVDLSPSPPYEEAMSARFRMVYRISIPVMIVCAVSDLLIGAAEMSGRPMDEVFQFLPTVLLKTHFGAVLLIRSLLLLFLFIISRADRRKGGSRGPLYLMLGMGLVVALSESASGHASDTGDLSATEIVDWLHLVAASLWGGGLFTLAVVILPVLMRQDDRSPIAGAAFRFSRMGGYAVGIIVLTSLYNAWSYVGSVEALWKSPYGLTATAKIFLFLVVVTIGAFNRYVSVPLLRERTGILPAKGPGIVDRLAGWLFSGTERPGGGPYVEERFLRLVRLEALVVVAVLFCAALLRHEVPARHFQHLTHLRSGAEHADHGHMHYAADQNAALVRIETNPIEIRAGRAVSITVHLADRQGKPLRGLERHHERILHAVIIGSDLDIFAHIHPEDLGAVTAKMIETGAFPLRYVFPKAGEYLVGLDFATEEGLYSKSVRLSVSGEPRMGPPGKDLLRTKTFGPYEVSLTSVQGEIRAGKATTLTYYIREHGKPVTDLEPYLGAAMHLAVVRSDLTRFMHVHGEVPSGDKRIGEHAELPGKFGPEIGSTMVFPTAGIYKIFGQVQHNGKTLLFDFMVRVR